MNAPQSGSRSVMLTWQREVAPSLESVRLLYSAGRLRASGRIVAAANPAQGIEAFNASFNASVERLEDAVRLLFRTTTADEERQITLSRSEDGIWLINHGDANTERGAFDGAIDVDIAGAVTFNALPVRRLGLHREPATHELPVLCVSLPDLSVRLARQTYRTVSIDDGGGAVINYSEPGYTADITVDRDGMVIDFPGRARRI
ncbi:MAG TPA: putative glycolipid-binding domain-containing protein [Actinophytocola sp.]|uniref:putative glycolipid-binding domain-containing protein n=1 Tax=Actinophytocola sp. TaxID=1872138 RepID=UPI002DDCC05B|nr:putative glycolipid-binding domain-containing protein [Actinophytocola sp.]HEV2780020.1 putative glycolipid-binding domain-containing protein [Actinophytocola sp.]